MSHHTNSRMNGSIYFSRSSYWLSESLLKNTFTPLCSIGLLSDTHMLGDSHLLYWPVAKQKHESIDLFKWMGHAVNAERGKHLGMICFKAVKHCFTPETNDLNFSYFSSGTKVCVAFKKKVVNSNQNEETVNMSDMKMVLEEEKSIGDVLLLTYHLCKQVNTTRCYLQ